MFGRRYAPDARDRNYMMRPLLLDPLVDFFPRGIPEGTRHYFSGPILDQGQTGTCVAHGSTAKINAAPIMQRMPGTPFEFYRLIVKNDEFPDNDYEATAPDSQLQYGTSVRAAMKTLQQMGYAKNYVWAAGAEDERDFILAGFGGVVIGIDWKTDMMRTDSDGFIHYTGVVEGGHCVYINGWNDHVKVGGRTVRAARIQNSWGTSWGDGGRCWMSMEDLDMAMQDYGEGAALIENKIASRKL